MSSHNDALATLKRIRKKTDEAVLLAKVLPHRRSEICRTTEVLVDLALACCNILDEDFERLEVDLEAPS